MNEYKTLFTCKSGISLLNMGSGFEAWDESQQEEPLDEYTTEIQVPVADIKESDLGDGSYTVINPERVIIVRRGEK